MEDFAKCNSTGEGVLTYIPHCPKPYGKFIHREQCLVCTADTITNRVVHSNNTFGSFVKQEPLSYITSTAMLSMISLIVHLKWSSVCVIFDNETIDTKRTSVLSWEKKSYCVINILKENGKRRKDTGEQRKDNGERSTKKGEWRKEDKERSTEKGEQRKECGEWRKGNGEQRKAYGERRKVAHDGT
ncbi:unnamed protein product [Mytilus coruscus]|uniref:Uncharacterized protein n=1 Tax=Mytilus coruscus TaxID=42192 RepID=A0A6J8DCL5_MYTCO|nr:unnamed protein product [Mytilus coruscus]